MNCQKCKKPLTLVATGKDEIVLAKCNNEKCNYYPEGAEGNKFWKRIHVLKRWNFTNEEIVAYKGGLSDNH